MRRILIINPNTTRSVTDRVAEACRQAHPDLQWTGATARFGAPYIASEATYAVAAHAVLDSFEFEVAQHGPFDAVLIACFGDPGLLALREVAGVPVVGLAQASFEAAGRRGPFAVVTGGRAWEPMLRRFARMHQLDAQLRGIFTIALTGAQVAADPGRAQQDLIAACQLGLDAGATTVVLGGAGLAGMAAVLQPQLGAPVLDNVLLGAQAVSAAVAP
jgi:Asp/Glu/hydantoin racemase